MYDYLIVGAGFSGATLAERLASQLGKSVMVIDQRGHVGGNAYDYYDDAGILVHKYGPHTFHTNSEKIFAYLSNFTSWRSFELRVLSSVDDQLLPVPVNRLTVNSLFGLELATDEECQQFYDSVAEKLDEVSSAEDSVVAKAGRTIYEKFFRGYTRKQWGIDAAELDASVTARIPLRTNDDCRYFDDKIQVMPAGGYTSMFDNILSHRNITVSLNTNWQTARRDIPHRHLIFTGPVDEYFDRCFGALPYRSLTFRSETLHAEQAQPAAIVNYPNEHEYTRVTEYKQMTGQQHEQTTLVYEYPSSTGDPYYPMPTQSARELYNRYSELAAQTKGVTFAGRLGTYKYYNMDQVVGQALAIFSKIEAEETRMACGATNA